MGITKYAGLDMLPASEVAVWCGTGFTIMSERLFRALIAPVDSNAHCDVEQKIDSVPLDRG